MSYCQKCGAENPDIARFCMECGTEIVTHLNENKKDKKPGLWKRYKNKIKENQLKQEEQRKTKKRLKLEKTEHQLKSGMECLIKLPEFEVTGRSGATKAVATLAGGLIGFALTSGSTKKKREINSKLRMAEKGIVIANGDINGADLRIPWENILNVEGVEGNIYRCLIKLTDGSKIEVQPTTIRPIGKYMVQVLNPKCKGIPPEEKGW